MYSGPWAMHVVKRPRGQHAEGILASPASWAAITLATSLVSYALVRPGVCSSVPVCAAKHDAIPTRFNAYAACGLAMVLIGEMANLVSTLRGARETQAMIPDLRSRCMPSCLLVIAFLVLIGENAIFAASTNPWFANVRPDFQSPVYTVTFIEWLIIVPMLLVMAGHCALGRPLRELSRPVVVTNVYIVIAWMAVLTANATLRWCLVAVTLAMFGLASVDMVTWVATYAQAAPADLSSRALRPCLSLGLVALFVVYACIYLFALLGGVAPGTERSAHLVLNVGAKLAFSVAFVVLRGNEYHSTLTGVLRKLSTSNAAAVSILRGSFDVLLPCSGNAEGSVALPSVNAGDMQQLERALGRPVAGRRLSDLLADDAERARFAAYVRNAQRQAEEGEPLVSAGQRDWTCTVRGRLPPVAQVLNCRLALGPAPAPGAKGPVASVGCVVHLSVAPDSSWSSGGLRQMVAAMRLSKESPAGVLEEAAPPPEFEAFEPDSTTDQTARGSGASGPAKQGAQQPSGGGDRAVASLLDLARLGMSAILRSTRSASGGAGEAESGYDETAYKEEQARGHPASAADSGFSGGGAAGCVRAAEGVGPEEPLEAESGSFSIADFRNQVSERLGVVLEQDSLEPEEERWSRTISDEQVAGVPAPDLQAQHGLQPVVEKKAGGSLTAAALAAAQASWQDMLDWATPGERRSPDTDTVVTVTVRLSPAQFGIAIGAVVLAATVPLLSPRRRI